MNRTVKSLIAGALLLPAMSFAEGLSYNYVEAGYAHTKVDVGGGDVEGDIINLRGSLAVAPNWHIFADANQTNFGNNVDGNLYDVGVGFNHALGASAVDFIGRAAWVKVDGDIGDDDGFGLQALLRSAVAPNFELEGGVQYVDFGGEDGDDTSFVAAGRYFFMPNFATGLSVSVGDDVTNYGIDFRFNFK